MTQIFFAEICKHEKNRLLRRLANGRILYGFVENIQLY